MLKLSKLTDYATVLMTLMAANPGRLHSAHDLANRSHVAAPTVAKLLKVLAKAGLVDAVRGAQGGYRLTRSPAQVTVADIIRAIEGPIALTQCSVHQGCCVIEPFCGVRSNWRLINNAIRNSLESVTLAQMVAPLKRSHPEFALMPALAGGGVQT